jgi:hypothetical protein
LIVKKGRLGLFHLGCHGDSYLTFEFVVFKYVVDARSDRSACGKKNVCLISLREMSEQFTIGEWWWLQRPTFVRVDPVSMRNQQQCCVVNTRKTIATTTITTRLLVRPVIVNGNGVES